MPSDRAAYQVSQSLFDVLRAQCEDWDLQGNFLKAARDQAQCIHVKADKQKTTQCVHNISQAWEAALKLHLKVFTELAQVFDKTAASKSMQHTVDSIRVALQVSEDFRNMLNKDMLHDTTPATSKANESLQKSVTKRALFDDGPGIDQPSPGKKPKLQDMNSINDLTRPAQEQPRDTHSRRRHSETTFKTVSSPAFESQRAAASSGHASSGRSDVETPMIEHLDVTTEVEARLRAKKDKKEKKKLEKKRKRWSTESYATQDANNAANLVERPKSKKPRLDNRPGSVTTTSFSNPSTTFDSVPPASAASNEPAHNDTKVKKRRISADDRTPADLTTAPEQSKRIRL